MNTKNKLISWIEKRAIGLIACATERVDIDPGAWQRAVDQRYLLERDEDRFSLYDGADKLASFIWKDILEIQYLKRDIFPPLMWKIVSESGNWLIPAGGRYAEELTDEIYALPGYHTQQVVYITPPTGYQRAMSMWRKNDRFPPEEPSESFDLGLW